MVLWQEEPRRVNRIVSGSNCVDAQHQEWADVELTFKKIHHDGALDGGPPPVKVVFVGGVSAFCADRNEPQTQYNPGFIGTVFFRRHVPTRMVQV